MAHIWAALFALQHLIPYCHASPRFGVRAPRPQITPAPDLGTVYSNGYLRRQDSCTWQCAVCAMYAPCETCISLSTPAGMECCTSKLADQSACPTGNVPSDSTIYLYTVDSTLTLYRNPTSLVMGTNTLTPGATPATANGHTLSIPTTAANYTGGGIIEDGTTRTLGTPISTIVGTGTVSVSSSTNTNTDTNTNTNTATGTDSGKTIASTSTGTGVSSSSNAASVSCYHMADPQNTCAAIANGPGWCECGNDPATYAIMPSPAPQPCAWTTTPPTTSFNCSAPTRTSAQSGTDSGSGVNTQTGTAISTSINVPPALSTYTIDGIPLTGNPTSLVAGTATLSPGGSSLTSSGHSIAILTSATNGQIQVDGSTTSLSSPNTASASDSVMSPSVSSTVSGSVTSTSMSSSTNTAAPVSTYTIDGIPFTGNPTSLVAGTTTLTPGGPPLTSSGHTVAIPTSATNGQIQFDGTSTQLPSPNSASGTGTNAGSINITGSKYWHNYCHSNNLVIILTFFIYRN